MDYNQDTSPQLHGARRCSTNPPRRRKGASEYAAEHPDDLASKFIMLEGKFVDSIVCKFCCVVVGARSDRIKDHLNSKRHMKRKLLTLQSGAQIGEHSSDCNSNLSTTAKTTTTQSTVIGERSSMTDDDLANLVGQFQNNESQSAVPLHTLSNNDHVQASKPADLRMPISMGKIKIECSPTQPSNDLNGLNSPLNPTLENSLYVRWNGHAEYIRGKFKIGDAFADVTLSAENQYIECHKLILAAGSDYFKETLEHISEHSHHHHHSVIVCFNTQYEQLLSVVQFLYTGEVVVGQEKLKLFLNTAEALGVLGLKNLPKQVYSGNVSVKFSGLSNPNHMNCDQPTTSMYANKVNPQVSVSTSTSTLAINFDEILREYSERMREASGVPLRTFTENLEGAKQETTLSHQNVAFPHGLFAKDLDRRRLVDEFPTQNLRTCFPAKSKNQSFQKRKQEKTFPRPSAKKRTVSPTFPPVYNF